MPSEATVLCPACGWTGPQSALEVAGSETACPVCGEVVAHDD